jgi:hypothetical protein
MSRKFAVGIILGLLIFPRIAALQEAPVVEAIVEEEPQIEFEDFLLEDEEFSLEEGVWSDEFEDGRESDAWFPYDPGYFSAINVASPRDPRIPHEEATIYDAPINAEEIEGLLSIKGNLPPPGAAPEASTVFDPADLRRYKVITTDPIRGEFRADLKIALRGRTFGLAQVNFFVREHDWKFDGAREARMVVYLVNPPEELTQVGYEANWNQAEYFNPLYRFLDIQAEDNIIVQLRRTEDNQIQLWTAEDDADLEFRARLGAPIETELADIVIGIQSTGLGSPDSPEGTVTIDSFTIRGPEVPDVEEGTEDQALIDLRETLKAEYELDVLGRFEYSEAALAANRAFTWMHYYGTQLPYPKILLPGIPQQGPGAPQQNLQVEIDTMRVTKTATLGTVLEDLMDSQPFPRGDRAYFDMAFAKYKQAAGMTGGSPYSNIASQVEWLHDVALERIIRLLMVFRGRAPDAVIQGGGIVQEGLVSRKIDLDINAGVEPQHSLYDPRIRIFEGRLSPDAKSEVLAVPEAFALQVLVNYFGPEAEIQRPVDLIGRVPFLFDPEWMTIPLTLFVPDISQEVLQRLGAFTGPFLGTGLGLGGVTQGLPGAQSGILGQLGGGAPFGTSGGFSGLTGGGGNLSGFQAIDPNLLVGRGYAVVEYYGARYGVDEQIVRDELGRIDPRATTERAFPELRDFPGFTDIVTEILDPDQHGSAIIEWDFNFADLAQVLTVPRTGVRVDNDKLPPPDPQSLYLETEIPSLVNQDNPEATRRFTCAEYFGWDLGTAGTFREPDRQGNRLAAFDSAPLPVGTDIAQ